MSIVTTIGRQPALALRKVCRLLVPLFLIAALTYLSYSPIKYAYKLHNALSTTLDPWSEADAIRSAQAYFKKGLFQDAGLPEISYGSDFPFNGFSDKKLWKIYTHYPPLPNYLTYIGRNLYGKDAVSQYRLIPIYIHVLGLIASAILLVGAIGLSRTTGFFLILTFLPITYSAAHHLHYHGYAASLLLLQTSYNLYFFSRREFLRSMLVNVFFGLIQGFLSFDYFFVVVGAPYAISIVQDINYQSRTKRILGTSAPAALGFMVAHLLHFFQVSIFYKSFELALHDFLKTIPARAFGETSRQNVLTATEYFESLWHIIIETPKHEMHLGLTYYIFLTLQFLAVAVSLINYLRIKQFDLTILNAAKAINAAFIFSIAWSLVMPFHAKHHAYFISRHLILAVYISLLSAIKVSRSHQIEPRPVGKQVLLAIIATSLIPAIPLVFSNCRLSLSCVEVGPFQIKQLYQPSGILNSELTVTNNHTLKIEAIAGSRYLIAIPPFIPQVRIVIRDKITNLQIYSHNMYNSGAAGNHWQIPIHLPNVENIANQSDNQILELEIESQPVSEPY